MDDDNLDLHVATRSEAGVTVVSVRGEVDAASVPLLEPPLREAIGRGAPLVLDLVDCEFVDSTGLHKIIEASSELERLGLRFALACVPQGPVVRVVEVALPGVLDLRASAAEAVAALAG